MCGQTHIDMNPQIGAIEYPSNKAATSLVWNAVEQAWVCPNCNDDAYLMDYTPDTGIYIKN